MTFLLFDKDEKYLGTLKNVIKAEHIEEINGENTLSMSTLDVVEKGQRIIFKDPDGDWQEFIIAGMDETKTGKLTFREIYAEHSIYEIIGDYIVDKRPREVTANIALGVALEPTRWSVGIVDDLGIKSTNFYHISAKEALHEVAKVWKGELQYRIEVSGSEIVGRHVDLLSKRGHDTGKRFTYTKDLDGVSKKTHSDTIITALYGYGKGEYIEPIEVSGTGGLIGGPTGEVGGVIDPIGGPQDENDLNQAAGGYGRRLDFKEINDDKAYVENLEAKEVWGRNNQNGSKSHVFGVVEFDDCEDKYELLDLTTEALEDLSKPKVTYEADVVDLKGFIFNDWLDDQKNNTGRNLLLDSDFSKGVLDGWEALYGTHQIKNSFYILTLTSTHNASRAQYYTDTLEPGIYTFSMLAKSEKGFRYDRLDGTEYERKDIEGSRGFKFSYITFEVTEPQQVYIRMYFNNPEVGDAVEIDWVKLEKTTPWLEEQINLEGRNLLKKTTATFQTVNHSQYFADMSGVLNLKVYGLSVGEVLTASVYVKTTSIAGATIRFRWLNGTNSNHANDWGTALDKNSEGMLVITSKIPAQTDAFQIVINADDNDTNTGTFEYKLLKLEKGSTATPWNPALEEVLSWTPAPEDLEVVKNYDHEGVSLGDRTQVIDKEFTPELRLQSRVIQLKRDLLNPENNKITLGNFLPSITDTWSDTEDYINNFRNKESVWDRSNLISSDGTIDAQYLNRLVDQLNTNINSSGGYVYISEEGDGLITYDRPLDQDPTMAIQIKGGSFRIANSKLSDGTWEWRTFGDGDGFVADEFVAGILRGGNVEFDLTNGTLLIGNDVENYNLLFDGSTLNIRNAEIDKVVELEGTIDDLEADFTFFKSSVTIGGGSNLIKNSVGYNGTAFWDVLGVGENLLIDGDISITNSLYPTGRYDLIKPILEGTPLVVSLKGTLNPVCERWGLYNSGGAGTSSISSLYRSDIKDGVFIKRINWKVGGSDNNKLFVYAMPNSGTVNTIEWIELKEGWLNYTNNNSWILDGVAKYGWVISQGGISQSITLQPHKDYTLSGKYLKETQAGTIKIELIKPDTGEVIESIVNSSDIFDGSFVHNFNTESVRDVNLVISIDGASVINPVLITDLFLAEGRDYAYWSQAAGETYTMNVKMDERGIVVHSKDGLSETIMSPEQFAGYYNNEKIFALNGDITEVIGMKIIKKGLYLQPIKFVQTKNSVDVVWTGVEEDG